MWRNVCEKRSAPTIIQGPRHAKPLDPLPVAPLSQQSFRNGMVVSDGLTAAEFTRQPFADRDDIPAGVHRVLVSA